MVRNKATLVDPARKWGGCVCGGLSAGVYLQGLSPSTGSGEEFVTYAGVDAGQKSNALTF